MNKERFKRLNDAASLLEEAYNEIGIVRDEEQEAYDNIPESLQSSERAERMQEFIDVLEWVCNDMESALDNLHELIAK